MGNKTVTALEISDNRKKLDLEISKDWGVMRTENVLNKTYPRYYDLRAIYTNLKKKHEERVLLKIQSLCVNLGYLGFSSFPKDSMYWKIYRLSELREILVGLNKVRTISPQLKVKLGKRRLRDSEQLTRGFIESEKQRIQSEVNALDRELKLFNQTTHLIVDDPEPQALPWAA